MRHSDLKLNFSLGIFYSGWNGNNAADTLLLVQISGDSPILCDHDIKPNEHATTQKAATCVARVKYPLFNFVYDIR